MLVPLLARGVLRATRPVPSAVVVAVTDEATRADSESVADLLRRRGIPAEIAPGPPSSASRSATPTAVASRSSGSSGSDGEAGSVKDIRTGEQVPADPRTWSPPPEDLHPRVVRATDVDEESHP